MQLVNNIPFSYHKNEIPINYVCNNCGQENQKLWREYNTFNLTLKCKLCALKSQNIPIDWKLNTDKIGNLILAVPTEENNTFWGYSSVPLAGCRWWYNLKPHLTKHSEYLLNDSNWLDYLWFLVLNEENKYRREIFIKNFVSESNSLDK